jgi:hypothetical protein
VAGINSSGFEIPQRFDLGNFPKARSKRSGPPPSSARAEDLFENPAGAAPRMRIFPFAWNETASSRRTISGKMCRGPALYKSIQLGTSALVSPISKTVEVGIASSRVTENGVALTTPRPYTLMLELVDPFLQIASAAGQGFPIHTTNPLLRDYIMPLDLVIYDAEFYPVVSLWNNTGNVQQWQGNIRVLEQVRLDKLGDYMGL